MPLATVGGRKWQGSVSKALPASLTLEGNEWLLSTQRVCFPVNDLLLAQTWRSFIGRVSF